MFESRDFFGHSCIFYRSGYLSVLSIRSLIYISISRFSPFIDWNISIIICIIDFIYPSFQLSIHLFIYQAIHIYLFIYSSCIYLLCMIFIYIHLNLNIYNFTIYLSTYIYITMKTVKIDILEHVLVIYIYSSWVKIN